MSNGSHFFAFSNINSELCSSVILFFEQSSAKEKVYNTVVAFFKTIKGFGSGLLILIISSALFLITCNYDHL